MSNRADRPMPNGIPRYVRCYDDPYSGDRYTLVFTGNYAERIPGTCDYIGCNSVPTHPTHGIWQHGQADHVIDRPSYFHLGKRIKFTDLPEIVQQLFIVEYKEVWGI